MATKYGAALANMHNSQNEYKKRNDQLYADNMKIQQAYTDAATAYDAGNGYDTLSVDAKNYHDSFGAQQQVDAQAKAKRDEMNWFERSMHTVGDTLGNVVQGVFKFGENVIDAGATLFGADEEWIKTDHVDEWFGTALREGTQGSYLHDGKVGETVRSVAGAVGNILPSVLVSAIPIAGPVLGKASFMTSAAGGGMESALNDGATRGQALAYGGLSGATEGLIESMSGGIGGLGKGFIQSGAKALGKGSARAVAKTGAAATAKRVGSSMIGEGLEEVAMDIIDPLLQGMTYTDGADYSDMSVGSLFDTFTVGALTGGVMKGGNALANKASDTLGLRTRLGEINELGRGIDESFARGRINEAQRDVARSDLDYLRSKAQERFLKQNATKQAKLATSIGKMDSHAMNNLGLQTNADGGYSAVDVGDNNHRMNSALYSPSNMGRESSIEASMAENGTSPMQGEFTAKGKAEYDKFLKYQNALSKKGKSSLKFAVSETSPRYKAYLDGDVMIIGKDAFENGTWRNQLVHEHGHFAEKTKQHRKYMDNILNTTSDSDKLAIDNMILDSDYGITREDIDTYNGARATKSMTDKHRLYEEEFTAMKSEQLFGNEAKIAKLARSNPNLAVNMYRKLANYIEQLSANTPEERTQKAELQQKLNLFEKALSNAGVDYMRGGNSDDELDNQSDIKSQNPSKKNPTIKYALHNDKQLGKIAYIDKKLINPKSGQSNRDAAIEFFETNLHGLDIVVQSSGETVKIQQHDKYYYGSKYNVDKKIKITQIIDDMLLIGKNKSWKQNKTTDNQGNIKKHLGLSASRGWDYYDTQFMLENNKGTYDVYSAVIVVRKSGDGMDYLYEINKFNKIKEVQYLVSKLNSRLVGNNTSSITNSISNSSSNVNTNERNMLKSAKKPVKYSLKPTIEADILKHYGTTYNWREVGYILPDGSRPDMSGRKLGAPGGHRAVDHRDVFNIDEYSDTQGSKAMVEFMSRGNIRVSPEEPGINLQVEPTEAQYKQIQNLVETLGWKEKAFSVDFDDAKGNVIDNLVYTGNTPARKVISDIKYYFKEGKLPHVSDLAQFRYSMKPNANKDKAKLSDSITLSNISEASDKKGSNRKIKKITVGDSEQMLKGIIDNAIDSESEILNLKVKEVKELARELALESEKLGVKGDGKIAVSLAKKIVENATIRTNAVESRENRRIVGVFNYYKGKLNLDGIKGDIKHYYDKEASLINRVWGGGNIGVDTIVDELNGQGIYIQSENASDIFIDMMNDYNKAKSELRTVSELAIGRLSKKDRNSLEQLIIKKILWGIDKMRRDRGFTGKEVADEIKRLKIEQRFNIKALAARNRSVNNIFWQLDVIRDNVKRPSATKPWAKEYITMANVLRKLTTRGNFSYKAREVLVEYSGIYSKVRSENGKYIDDVDLGLITYLDEMSKGEGDFTNGELDVLGKVLERFIFVAREHDIVFFNGQKVEAATQSSNIADELTSVVPRSKQSFKYGANKIMDEMTDPWSYFQRLSGYDESSATYRMYLDIQDGDNKCIAFERNADRHFEEYIEKNKKLIKHWREKLDKNSGSEISIGQAISLILSYERQSLHEHFTNLSDTAFKVDVVNDQYMSKGKTRQALDNQYEMEVTHEQVQAMKRMLTTEQLEYIQLAKAYFNEIAGEEYAEVGMRNFGVTNVSNTGDYYPGMVSTTAKYVDMYGERANINPTIKQFGWTKSVNEKAANKLLIENVLDVVDRNIAQMAQYVGYTESLRMFNRVWNYALPDGVSVKAQMNVVDPSAEQYIKTLLQDVQGMDKGNHEDNFISKTANKVYGWGVTAAIGLNPKVLFNQTLALTASLNADVSIKDLTVGVGLFTKHGAADVKGKLTHGAEWESLKKKMLDYSTLAYDRVKHGPTREIAYVKSLNNKVGDLSTAGIGYMDTKTTEILWLTSLTEVRRKSGLTGVYTEQELHDAGVRLNDIIIKTQPTARALYNSKIKRSNSLFAKFSTVFFSDQLKQNNILKHNLTKYAYLSDKYKGVKSDEVKSLLSKAMRGVGRSAIITVTNLILLTLISQLFKWVTDTQEDDLVIDMATDFGGNILGMLPIIREVSSLIKGFKPSNFYETGLTNLYNGSTGLINVISNLANGEKFNSEEVLGQLRRSIVGLSQALGIPLRNLEKYALGISKKFNAKSAHYYDAMIFGAKTKDLNSAIKKDNDKEALAILDVMLTRDKASADISEDALKAMLELYKKNGTSSKGYSFNLPISIKREITYTVDGVLKEKTLSATEYKKFESNYSKAAVDINKLVKSSSFRSLSNKEKAISIERVYDFYYKLAKGESVGELFVSQAQKVFADVVGVSKMSMFMAQINSIESKGKPAYYRRREIDKILRGYRFTFEQKQLALMLAGYKPSSPYAVINLIRRSNLIAADKKELIDSLK